MNSAQKADKAARMTAWKPRLDYIKVDSIDQELWEDEEFVEYAILRGDSYYEYISPKFRKNPDWWLDVVHRTSSYHLLKKLAQDTPEHLLQDPKMVRHLLSKSYVFFNYFPEELRDNKEIALMALRYGHSLDLYEVLGPNLRKDFELTKLLARCCANKLEDMGQVHSTKEAALEITQVSTDSAFYRDTFTKYEADISFVQAALEKNPAGYANISDDLKEIPSLLWLAISRCPKNLDEVPSYIDLTSFSDERVRIIAQKEEEVSFSEIPKKRWEDSSFAMAALLRWSSLREAFSKALMQDTDQVVDGLPSELLPYGKDKDFLIDLYVMRARACEDAPFAELPIRFRNDKEFALTILFYHPEQYPFLSEELRGDRDIVRKATENQYARRKHYERGYIAPAILQHAPDHIFQEKELILRFVRCSEKNYEHARQWKLDVDVAMEAVSLSGGMFSELAEEMRANEDVCLEAIRSVGYHTFYGFPDIAASLRADKNFMKKAFAHTESGGKFLQACPPALQSDKELALLAVMNDGGAVEYVSDALKEDPDVARWVALNSGSAFMEHCSALLDDTFSYYLLLDGHYNFKHCSVNIRGNKTIIRRMVDSTASHVQYIVPELQQDFTFLKELIAIDADVGSYLPKESTEVLSGQLISTKEYRGTTISSLLVPRRTVSKQAHDLRNIVITKGEQVLLRAQAMPVIGFAEHGPVGSYLLHSENNSFVLLGDFLFYVSERGLDGRVGSRSSHYHKDTDADDRRNRLFLIDRTGQPLQLLRSNLDSMSAVSNIPQVHRIALDKPVISGVYVFGTTPYKNHSDMESHLQGRYDGKNELKKWKGNSWKIHQKSRNVDSFQTCGGAAFVDTDDFGPCWLFPKEDGSYTWEGLKTYLNQRTDSTDWEILQQRFIHKATPQERAFLRRHYEGTSLAAQVIAYLNQNTSDQ